MTSRPTDDRGWRSPNSASPSANGPAKTACWPDAEPLEPLVEPLSPTIDPWDTFRRLVGLPHCLFLDSAQQHPTLGRYSFVAADPFCWFTAEPDQTGALCELQRRLDAWRAKTIDGLPPFQGGAAGLFGYDLSRQIERLPQPRIDEFGVPAMAVGFYDLVVAFDHQRQQAWIISHGFPEVSHDRRMRRAEERLRQFRRYLSQSSQSLDSVESAATFRGGKIQTNIEPPRRVDTTDTVPSSANRVHDNQRPQPRPAANRNAGQISPRALAPQFEVGQGPVTSNFSREGYLRTIERAIRYIYDGDLFQVNLSQRLLAPQTVSSLALYEQLRRDNPSPFAGYFDLGTFQILSTSPERFLRVDRGVVETRPIKGTRRRVAHAEANLFAGDELRANAKDRAENVMIVDLLRNDLSRVCLPESVRVDALCRIESYRFVQHLVSVLSGRLRPDQGPVDLLRAAFPGGSITGAPKVRAMQIIAQLEPTARGAYCGALGYIGFDRAMDTNILIRTVTAGRGWWQAPVGGGIVAQSSPEAEYEETWQKAQGLLRALRQTDRP